MSLPSPEGARVGRALDADPAPTLSLRVPRGRGEAEARVKVSGHEPRRPQDGVRGPRVPMEEPDPVTRRSARPHDLDLSGEVRHDPYVVVTEHERHVELLGEQSGEEVEDDAAQWWGSSDDRVLRVARDEHGACAGGPGGREELTAHAVGGRLGRAARPLRGPPQPKVKVGDDQRPRPMFVERLDHERRSVGDGSEPGPHRGHEPSPRKDPSRVRSVGARPTGSTMALYIRAEIEFLRREAVPRGRELAIDRIRQYLERAGFYVADTHGIRPSSFDLAARRDATLVLLKVLKNIDALDAEEAARLSELGHLFPAIVLVIGQTSGANELDAGVVYTRYDVPIINEETLVEFLEKAALPFLYASPGGIFARVDGGRLRELRTERGLSLGTLASIAGVSRRAIQLYEDGAGAEITVIDRIESYLGLTIAEPIDLFRAAPPSPRSDESDRQERPGGPPGERAVPRSGDPWRDGVLDQLDGMGLEMTLTARAPFDALARTPDILLAAIGSLRTALHRAEVLHGLARVAEGHAMFVVRETVHRPSIDGLPILSVGELRRHRDSDDLLDAISEREGS